MFSKFIASSLVVGALFVAPAYAQVTIGDTTIPQEQVTMLRDYCRALLDEDAETATAADPTGTDNTVDTANSGAAADFSNITQSDCRDAGFTEPTTETETTN
ncbi:hypothetical protein [Devosia sp. Leaf64]|uniref:hypothetical protein n=1 Tax=Devosia sp. Leaf64 TaxID=1736229 RepID=UPI0007130F9F|nr:hypothetical protein [Devosia sp. Leaf64]KQN76871.1 hypothetical protein ASE94_18250 [Devosia sp. Leaf64]